MDKFGNKTAVTAFPGWATLPEIYVPLERAAKEIALRAVDFGYFSPPPLPSLALRDVVDANVPPGGAVFGCSMGALYALSAVAWGAARAAVIFSGFARFTENADCPGQKVVNVRSMRLGLKKDAANVLERFYEGLAAPANIRFKTPDRPPNAERLDEGLRLLLETDTRPLLSEIRGPVLILHGEQDRIVPVAAATWLAEKIPGATIRTFPTAGHAMIMTHAPAIAETIREFFARHDL